MVEDDCGYLYPKIDAQKCIGCNRCKNVCAFQNIDEKNNSIKTLVAVAKDNGILGCSASGGVFGAFGKAVIKDGGCAVGAAYDTNFSVKHILIDTEDSLEKLQGSKYTQSYIGTIFRKVKKKLQESDNTVLFSGCPCQVAGLKSYLGKEYANLITIDLICHGVPSNKMFKDFIKTFEKREKVTVANFNFRDKSLGWGINSAIETDNGKKITVNSSSANSYISYFLDGSIYRENCYKCKYANYYRTGDITIGDYWGIDKEHPELVKSGAIDTKKGVSVLIINTEKAAVVNTQLTRPTPCDTQKRERVLNIYRNGGWTAVEADFQKKYLVVKIKRKTKKIIKMILPSKVIQLLKKGGAS
ncbi:MAG: Coenzyme F420 hydrogenase/dehydrogenase, beta subunit C-terminal domain [Ruminococcus flavefaciens]|nr:Coenzyme F420 hydrogenase/dehydrogenase, beta subunit C-terminal domain [Ruminococcus flavefaciens]